MSRLGALGQWSYYALWFLRTKVGARTPLVNTMIINYECNLRCKHCSIVAHSDDLPGPHSMSFDLAVREMKRNFDSGARILFFEGGEPTLWHDGGKTLKDLIEAGRRIGYFVIGYTTNGTRDIVEDSDVISISLDGPEDIHDEIRGKGAFKALVENLDRTNHPNVFANMVVTKMNKDHVRETVEIAARNKKIKGIMLNFLTPPPYEIALDHAEKEAVVRLATSLKRQGYPILNTNRALRNLLEEDWSEECPYWASAFVMPDGSEFFGCPLRSTESCKACGFNAVREYRLIVDGNIETITQMSGRFALSTKR
ncbi:MAG: radical SAM protein [Methanomassiliicoccales archaeon]|nr:radical SAM protein [Methanomassiliicoccales archaeon]